MKKSLLGLIICCLVHSQFFAQVDQNFSDNLIKRYKSSFINEKSTSRHNFLWATPLLLEAKLNWERLTPEAKQVFRVLAERPTISNEEFFITPNFVLHYTNTGNDAVDQTDANSNQVPDYVERMAAMFDSIWAYDAANQFTMPPWDDSNITSDTAKYDIYIGDVDAWMGNPGANSTYGFVSPETLIGDNPRSTGVAEVASYVSWMGMRNSYSMAPFAGDLSMRVTAAHEFQHAIQFGYTALMGIWIQEMFATWSEDFNYPNAGDNYQYLSGVFRTPDIALNFDRLDAQNGLGDHWYSTWLFGKFMTEHVGNTIVNKIYNLAVPKVPQDQQEVKVEAVKTIDSALKANSAFDLDSLFIDYIIANQFLSKAPANAPYNYQFGDLYWDYRANSGGNYYENSFVLNGSPISYDSQIQGNGRLMRLGADYFFMYLDSAQLNYTVKMKISNFSQTFPVFLIHDGSAFSTILPNDNSFSLSDTTWTMNLSGLSNAVSCVMIVARMDKEVTDTTAVQYTININKNTSSAVDENIFSEYKVYPNPAKDMLSIDFGRYLTNAGIKVTDILGRVVINEAQYNGQSIKLGLSGLSDGVYSLIVENGGKIVTKKFMLVK